MKTMLRLRMSSQDAHYGGKLVDGARILALFGDVATELLFVAMAMKDCSVPMIPWNS